MEKKEIIDVLDFAMDTEKDGIDFYTRASKKFKEKELQKLFIDLAKEEAKHLKTFIGIKAKVKDKAALQSFRPEKVEDFIASIIHEGLFPKGETMTQQLSKIKTVGEVCALAMQAEKNAILLYTELAKLSKSKEHKKVLEKIANEEKSHLVMVRAMRADHDPVYAAMTFGKFF